jgi:hypothetical protein
MTGNFFAIRKIPLETYPILFALTGACAFGLHVAKQKLFVDKAVFVSPPKRRAEFQNNREGWGSRVKAED